MSRAALVAALAAAAVLCAACNSQTISPPAKIAGTHDVAMVGDLLFVTSTDRSELRVLDVVNNRYVAAPNPLEALSVPVLDRPSSLTSDRSFTPGVKGRYVYAVSTGAAQISVVSAALEDLVEVARLSTTGTVTAAVGSAADVAGGPSTLFYATQVGGEARLWRVDLPTAEELKALDAQSLERRVASVGALPGESVQALLGLPNNRLAVATRAQGGRTGRTFVMDLASLALTPLQFPAPVRMLETHDATGRLEAGQWIFGALDEESCGTATPCRGILAVDSRTGAPAVFQDASVTRPVPMLPIAVGSGLVKGLSLGVGVSTNIPTTLDNGISYYENATVEILGAATFSTGEILLFNAGALKQFDVNLNGPSAADVDYVTAPDETHPDGISTAVPEGTGPQGIALADGATVSQTVYVIYQGRLPGLIQLVTSDSDGVRFPVANPQAYGVLPGDRIVVLNVDGACAEVAVASVESDGLTADAAPNCSGRTAFSVRAAGATPYVVNGDAVGYMGRVASGGAFSYAGQYFYYPPDYQDATKPILPALSFTMGADPPGLGRDTTYSFAVSSNYSIYLVTVDPYVASLMHQPSTVLVDAAHDRLWTAFPSGNTVTDISLQVIVPGVNGTTVRPWK